jgi:hypothetical protein
VQEQQSKAKITGELLLARRRLDEERSRAELLTKELRKAKSLLEEDRGRRTSAQDAHGKLQSEASQLRAERRQLQDLRSAFDKLHEQKNTAEVELTALVQKMTSLEATEERTRGELERAQASNGNMQQQLEELQTRLHRAQESGERLNEQRSDERTRAEQMKQNVESLQKDLAHERAERERLDDQQALLMADLDRAEKAETAARELLSSTCAQHAELEDRTETCQSESAAARSSAQSAQLQHEAQLERMETFRSAAAIVGENVKCQVDLWMRGLLEESSEVQRRGHRDGGAAPRDALVSRGVVEEACIASVVNTPPRRRPNYDLSGASARTVRGEDDEAGEATSPEVDSVATQQPHVATPPEAATVAAAAIGHEAPTPRRLADSQSQLEESSSLQDGAQAPGPTLLPQTPGPTVLPQALPWSLQVIGESLQQQPSPARVPPDTELMAETAVSPVAPPSKRRRSS